MDALLKCGIQKQDAKRKIFKVNKKYHFKDEETQSEYTLDPYNGFKVDVTIDYESKVLPKSEANLNSIDEFVNDISPSRTFVFLHEIQSLFNLGLIKGGDLSNAIVFVEDEVNSKELFKLADIFNKKDISVKEQGILNNVDLYYENEPARHKLLDVIGDLSLMGISIQGHLKISKPCHNVVKMQLIDLCSPLSLL